MTGQVQGKVALVTGGASGIGEAVSELLAREGASVAVTDVDDLKGPEVVARIKKGGGEASFWHHDVTSEERWIEVVAEVMKRYGRLDVLVSNAGIGISVPTITEMSLSDWRRHPRQLGASRHHRHADLGQDPGGGDGRRTERADRPGRAGEACHAARPRRPC